MNPALYPAILLIILNFFDLSATMYLLSTGEFIEANPFLSFLLGFGVFAFILYKAGICQALILFLYLQASTSRNALDGLRLGAILYGAVAIVHIYYIIERFA